MWGAQLHKTHTQAFRIWLPTVHTPLTSISLVMTFLWNVLPPLHWEYLLMWGRAAHFTGVLSLLLCLLTRSLDKTSPRLALDQKHWSLFFSFFQHNPILSSLQPVPYPWFLCSALPSPALLLLLQHQGTHLCGASFLKEVSYCPTSKQRLSLKDIALIGKHNICLDFYCFQMILTLQCFCP